jgi:hypothetical protein
VGAQIETLALRLRAAFHPRSVGAVRVALLLLLVGELLVMGILERPDLLHPTQVGSDPATYYASGQRLNAGHNLYGPLKPGDRLVPGYPGPYPAPTLSPPLVAVLWRPLALLPGDTSMVLWWLGGLVVLTGITTAFTITGRRFQLALLGVLLLLGPPVSFVMGRAYLYPGYLSPISLAALSGNLNTYLVGLFALSWWASSRARPGIAGGAMALATALKLGPVMLLWWFITQRSWRSVRAFLIVGIALGVVGVVFAGTHANAAYVKIALGGGVRPTALSIPGMLQHGLGISAGIARYGTYVGVVLGAVVIAALRHHPRASFSVAILTTIYATPVIYPGNFAVLVAAAAPWVLPLPGRGGAAQPEETAPDAGQPEATVSLEGSSTNHAAVLARPSSRVTWGDHRSMRRIFSMLTTRRRMLSTSRRSTVRISAGRPTTDATR